MSERDDAEYGHANRLNLLADENRRAPKEHFSPLPPEGAALEVYRLKSALIEAFQRSFVMDSKHVFRIAEQIAADLYRQGVVAAPGLHLTQQTLESDLLRFMQHARDQHEWYRETPPDTLAARAEFFAQNLLTAGYRKVG